MRIRISLLPKILDSTFPIASEEPGPGAFRCPGSPLPTTPPPPRNRNEAAQPRGRPCGLRGRTEAPAQRSLGHHRPHRWIPPVAAAAGALSRRWVSRRPAEARRGPARNCPSPPREPRERRRRSRSSAFSSLGRETLRPSGPPTAPRAPGSPPTQATQGSEAPAPRQLIDPRGNSVRRLQPPPRARAPSGLHRLLPALPPPPPPPPPPGKRGSGRGAHAACHPSPPAAPPHGE